MKRLLLFFCALALYGNAYAALKAGAQWTINNGDKKIIVLYADGDILNDTTIFNQFFNNSEALTFIHLISSNPNHSSNNDNIIHCPGFLDKYKEIKSFLSFVDDTSIKNELLKYFTNNKVEKIKATVDTLLLFFLESIKVSIDYFTIYNNKITITLERKSALSSLDDEYKYQKIMGSIKDLYDDAMTYLKDQIEFRSKQGYDSGLVFDAINCFEEKDKRNSIVNAWFKDVYSLLNYYKEYLFFGMLMAQINTSGKNVFIGITANQRVFFTVNKILNEQMKTYTLEKVVFPWQITTDKNYFKKMKLNNKQPDIRGLCAEWQYKYLFNKPLSLWEKTKLQLLTKRYLFPTAAIAATGLALGARWWLKSKNKPVAPSSTEKKSTEPVAKKV